MVQYSEHIVVSIHASVKDATVVSPFTFQVTTVSIHASVKDATPPEYLQKKEKFVSIHASVKDATPLRQVLHLRIQFQSTHL